MSARASTTTTVGEATDVSSREVVSGWGLAVPSVSDVVHPVTADELRTAATHPPGLERGVLARGLGRSYGDAAQNAGGVVVDTTRVDGIGEVDPESGTVRLGAGTSLDAVMRALVPQGWFVPVTPGTRQITVGGAIACDIHGKNHHADGAWCEHVTSMTLALPGSGEVVTIGPSPSDQDPELFWATAGGMGLTGIVLGATMRLVPIETSRLSVDTNRTRDLDEVMALMQEGDHNYRYSVAWIDMLARGRSMGRSVLTRARFATRDELSASARRDPLAFGPRVLAAAPPPPFVPPRLLNSLSVRAFNEFWFRKAPRRRTGQLQTIGAYFHPLDAVEGWNRLYGRAGFLQWQIVVPFGAEDVVRSLVEQLSASGCASFLAVLKRFRAADPGPLSFPTAGWTLALDMPGGDPRLANLLDALDEEVAAAGGRVYLAKDSRMRAELLPVMYPRLDEWRAVRARVDPNGHLQSDLGRRLGLV